MKITIIALLSLWATVESTGNECKQGVSYWCQSRDTAVNCDKLDYCQSVWKAKKVHQLQGTATCTVCKLAVTILKPYIENNATEQRAKNGLEEACKDLSVFQSECDSLVEDYFPDIWKLLEQELDGEEICNTLNLCSSVGVALPKAQPAGHHQLQGDGTCDLCKLALGELSKLVDNNVTQQKIEDFLESLCERALSPADCKLAIPMLWGEIEQLIDSGELCNVLGFCTNASMVMKQNPLPQGFLLCTVCKLIMKELDKVLEGNKTESAVMDAIDHVCERLPTTYSGECSNIVDKYGPDIYKLILEGITSDLICKTIGICTGDFANRNGAQYSKNGSFRRL